METYKADGFDDAIVGLDMTTTPYRIIYQRSKMIQILVTQEEMTEEDAIDYLAYNTWYDHGDGYPRFVEIMDKDEVFEDLDLYYDVLGGTGEVD